VTASYPEFKDSPRKIHRKMKRLRRTILRRTKGMPQEGPELGIFINRKDSDHPMPVTTIKVVSRVIELNTDNDTPSQYLTLKADDKLTLAWNKQHQWIGGEAPKRTLRQALRHVWQSIWWRS
jgi:hypothetical protein